MSIGEKLQTVAKKIPDVYHKGTVVGYSLGYENGQVDGRNEGVIEARGKCMMEHFCDSFFGSGTGKISCEIPFRPDVITIYTTHPFSSELANCYRGVTADLRGLGRHMGNVFYCSDLAAIKSGWLASSVSGKTFCYENGVFSFQMTNEQVKNVVWHPSVRYHIVAARFPEESGRQLIEEQIAMLPDAVPQGSSGQLTYDQGVIDLYFTADEWESLTATKKNWTFVLN